MKAKKQKPDFLHLGEKLLNWYGTNSRDLPWRKTKDPYKIWICEILLQQTQVKQGLNHYLRFVERFPDVKSLAEAHEDEVLLYWKGLGYYSRALNLHKASKQIMQDFDGNFPDDYESILSLKGVGKYTAAAIASIAFDLKYPAVDGNFYRVLSRLFADNFDISNAKAFQYFSELALLMMPEHQFGDFNEAMMDLGSEICKPKNPICVACPLNEDCLAFQSGTVNEFPLKTKKTKVTYLELTYYFINFKDQFLIKRRGDDFIWKKLYEFSTSIPEDFEQYIRRSNSISHKLTHKNLNIIINDVQLPDLELLKKFASENDFEIINLEEAKQKSFPKPLQNYLENYSKKSSFQGELF
ncbi:A/G-specific adenine glycosylase [Halpernia frigidisoli]|uniref:Adenine DNA glycosylase n=1 Tax=Halpernia frigidisoli TaxID=1125876 RepID=A0A1I3IT27_9FLAO|nr:A/G-specific adenine glycosylase [Halpernia frigidisoli]SFI51042.1 A/G-specific DNA-adenine glycosylase [Halpernia frigidisoli]